jgi:formylglycine-generating enzyme required for sulfatase activity
MEFVLVPKGKSWLGGGAGKPGDKEVEIPQDFYLGKYEVTQEEWEKVMGNKPSHFSPSGGGKDAVKGITEADLKRFQVEMVSWDDAQLFLGKLNQRDKQEGWVYRLPKEAEWKYASRGGPLADKLDSAFDFDFDKPTNQLLPDQANFRPGKKGLERTCKVGSYPPNRLGLYDMHGNVWEWCDDTLKAADGDSLRVHRGGCWGDGARGCLAAHRGPRTPDIRGDWLGFRLARVPVGKEIVKIAPEEKKPPVEAKLPPMFMNDLGMEFALVPKGKSWLGGGAGKPGNKEVEIAHDFDLRKYEVTQEE